MGAVFPFGCGVRKDAFGGAAEVDCALGRGRMKIESYQYEFAGLTGELLCDVFGGARVGRVRDRSKASLCRELCVCMRGMVSASRAFCAVT